MHQSMPLTKDHTVMHINGVCASSKGPITRHARVTSTIEPCLLPCSAASSGDRVDYYHEQHATGGTVIKVDVQWWLIMFAIQP